MLASVEDIELAAPINEEKLPDIAEKPVSATLEVAENAGVVGLSLADDEAVRIEDDKGVLVIVAVSIVTDVEPTTMELKLEKSDDKKLPEIIVVDDPLPGAVVTLATEASVFPEEELDTELELAVIEALSTVEDGAEAIVEELSDIPAETPVTVDNPAAKLEELDTPLTIVPDVAEVLLNGLLSENPELKAPLKLLVVETDTLVPLDVEAELPISNS